VVRGIDVGESRLGVVNLSRNSCRDVAYRR
jgi:hypothetical protein